MSELQHLSQAIEHLEAQRSILGDQVVDSAMTPLLERLAEIERLGDFPDHLRKQATILFTDIVASTEVASHLDPEDTRDIIDGALQQLAVPVSEHNGHVTRFRGDGFKAVFGIPQAREDDPRQAIHAGLAIIDTARKLTIDLGERWGNQEFQVRVGIHTGLVAVGGVTEAEDTIMGSTVNLAKRIEDQAPSNGLLISHDTYRHVRGIFTIRPIEPISAKGFDQRIPVYQVLGAKARSLEFKTTWVEGIETRMVGRATEVEVLKQARLNLVADRKGALVTIHGDAGIGKSRLIFEYLKWEETLPDFVRMFLGRSRQDIKDQPYAMWRELFSFRFEIQDTDPPDRVIQKLETRFGEVFGDDETSRMRAHFIGQLLGFDCSRCVSIKGVLSRPDLLREQATRYLISYFAGLSRIEPVLMVIEDLHWVDERSLELLEALGSITPQNRLLIICVARNIFFEQYPLWGQDLENCTILKLGALTVAESEQLVEEILQKVARIPPDFKDLLVSQTEGNPFYLEELVKMLIENGIIQTGQDRWQIAPLKFKNLQVPPTLTGVLQARLDSLPGEERHLLQLAAVFGKDFWDLAVQQVGDSQPVAEILEQPLQASLVLPSLLRRELIFTRGDSVFAGTRQYSFKHIMFRDVVYETTPKRERAAFHGLTADWLVAMTQANKRSDEYAAVIAGHYLSAGSTIYASDWFYRAGRRAKTQVAMHEARAYIEQARQLLPPDELQKRWLVQLEWDEIVGILGDVAERAAADLELLALAQQIGDDNLLAHAYYRQAFFLNSQGGYQAELAAHEKALKAAQDANNLLIETTTLGLKVVCLTLLGEMDQAKVTAEQALAYARQLGDDDTLAKVLGNVFTYYQVVDISSAVQLIQESIEIEDRMGDLNLKATSMINLGYIYTQTGLFKEGVDTFNSSLEIAMAIENPRLVAYNQLNMGLAYYRLEQYQEAAGILEQAQQGLEQINDSFALATCHTYLGMVNEATGQWQTAVDLFSGAHEKLKQLGVPGYAMDALAGTARCALAMGNQALAMQYAHEICEYLEQKGSEAMEFPILAYLTCARVFEGSGDQERRQKVIEEGYEQLMARAEKMNDNHWQAIFLDSIKENRGILINGQETNTFGGSYVYQN